LWLGHEQVATTHGYLEADLTMKQQILSQLQPTPWRRTPKRTLPTLWRSLRLSNMGPAFVQLSPWLSGFAWFAITGSHNRERRITVPVQDLQSVSSGISKQKQMPAPNFQSQLVSFRRAHQSPFACRSPPEPRRSWSQAQVQTQSQICSMVRIKCAKVSASKSRLTSIRRPSADTTSRQQVPGPLPLRWIPAKLQLNQSLSFALSLHFHPAPSETTLQCARRQIMLLTKFTPPQPTGSEFRHQAFDLLAAPSLPNANLSDFSHADSGSKTRPVR
jgi:hypothetical protein